MVMLWGCVVTRQQQGEKSKPRVQANRHGKHVFFFWGWVQ